MLSKLSKNATRRFVHTRIRKKVQGTSERPRLNVYRSVNHIYVQLIDDSEGKTIVAASSAVGKKGQRKTGGNLAAAKEIGKSIAEKAKANGIAVLRIEIKNANSHKKTRRRFLPVERPGSRHQSRHQSR